MIIREHCAPGTPRNPDGRLPRLAWPQGCLVQWGERGLVFGPSGGEDKIVAFFEAFPADPQTFLRGEGETVEAAELAAWFQWMKISECPGHSFETRGSTNGGGFCRHCNLFASGVFPASEDTRPLEAQPLLARLFGGDPTAFERALEGLDKLIDEPPAPPSQ